MTTCLRYAIAASAGWAGPALACGACAPLVAARIAAQPFWPTLLALAVPVAAVAVVGWAIHGRGAGR